MKITTSSPQTVEITEAASANRQVIAFNGLSEITLNEDTQNVLGMRRSGATDLLIKLRNGSEVLVQNYFDAPSNIEIHFLDSNGEVWTLENVMGTDQFVFTQNETSKDGGGMGLLGAAGLLGLMAAGAAAAGGGGGDGDTQPPAAPGLALEDDTGADGGDGISSNGRVEVSGLEAGATWEYSLDGGDTWHTGSGTSFVLADGSYSEGTVLVRQTDAAGNVSEEGTLGDVIIDTQAPDAPEIGEAFDDVGSITGPLANGATTDDTTPTFSGTGTPGEIITLYDGDTAIAIVVVGADGTWTIAPETPLGEGTHSFTVTATDAAGNESESSGSFDLTVDTTAPDAPLLSGVTAYDDVAPEVGFLTSGDATNDAAPTFAGTGGTQGETVTLYANGTEVATGTVGAGGAWSLTPGSDLADGDYDFTVTYTDEAGNESDPTAFALTIDTSAPTAPLATDVTVTDDVAPVTGALADGDVTDDTVPTVSGTGGVAGDTVTVYAMTGGVTSVLGTAVVGATGTWSLEPSTPLAEGDYALSVSYTDPAGNESAVTPLLSFTVDTTAPDAPLLSGVTAYDDVAPEVGFLTSGDATNDAAPTFAGTGGTQGETVTLYANGTEVATGTVDAGGAWSLTPGGNLADGDYDFTVTYTDEAGNESAPSAAFALTIDTSAPTAPSIGTVTDDVGTITGLLTSGGATDDAQPAFAGTGAPPGETITLYDGATAIGTTIVNPDGSWGLTPATPLSDGGHIFSATVTDAAGNESDHSAIFLLTIDTIPPAPPVIDDVENDAGDSLPDGSATNDSTPTFSGSGGVAGDTVTLYDGTTVIASGTVNPDGTWVLTPTVALDESLHDFSVTYTDPVGNESAPTDYALTVDTSAPTAPLATDVTVTDDVAPVTGALADGDVTDDTVPTVSGTGGVAGDTVTVYAMTGGVTSVLGTAVVGATGTWSLEPSTPLAEGDYALSVSYTDPAGNESAVTPLLSFTVDTTAPDAPLLSGVTAYDDVAPEVGFLTSGDATNDAAPTFAGTGGTQGETVTLYANGTEVATGTVGAGGAWSLTPGSDLADGDYDFTVTYTDEAGNESDPTAFALTIDTVVPAAPALGDFTVYDDFAPEVGYLTSGDSTNDTTPTFAGTVPSGSDAVRVNIYDNSGTTLMGTASVDPNTGVWTWVPGVGSELAEGDYSFTLTYTDAAGNESGQSDPFALTIDATAPTALTNVVYTDDVGSTQGPITDGSITDDTKPTASGNGAEPGATVTLWATIAGVGVAIGTGLADGSGNWSVTATDALAVGSYDFWVTQSDAAGNVSTPAGNINFSIDATSPVPPVITSVVDDVGATTGPLVSGATTDDPTPTVSGTAAADSTVTLYVDGVAAGSATSDGTGAWSLDVPLTAGSHVITATVTNAAGNESSHSAGFNVTFDPELPTAADNFEALALDVTPSSTEVPQDQLQSHTGFAVASAGVGAVLDLSLIDVTEQIQITVDPNTTQQITFSANAGGVTVLADFDLYVYKYDPGTDTWNAVYTEASWLEVYLLGGVADEVTLTLDEGDYAFVLATDSGVAVLTGYTLTIENQVIFDYDNPVSVAGTLDGNVLTDVDVPAGVDELPAGSVVTDVNGVTVPATGTVDVVGTYGTLTIYANGNYSYAVDPAFSDPYGSTDVFTYTVTSPNGAASSANLTVELNLGSEADVVAADATVLLSLDPSVSQVPEDQLASATNFGVLELATVASGENAILSASAIDAVGGIDIVVGQDTVHELTFDADAGGVSIYGEYYLLIYQLDPTTAGTDHEQYSLYYSDYWFTLYLLGATATEQTVSLPEGTYKAVLASGSAVSLLTGASIWVTAETIYDYGHPLEGPGSVLGQTTGDITADGVGLYRVDGALFTASPMTVVGDYGTLVINADGTYTYTVSVPADPTGWTPPFGEMESFTYTLQNADGSFSVGTLNIQIDMMGAQDDFDSVRLPAENIVTQETLQIDTSTFWGVTSDQASESGTFSVTNDAATKTVVTVDLSSAHVGANGTLTWQLTDNVSGTLIDSGVLTMTDGSTFTGSLSFDNLATGDYKLRITLDESGLLTYNEATAVVTVTTTDLDSYIVTEMSTAGNILSNDGSDGAASIASITIGVQTIATGNYAGDSSMTVAGAYGTLVLHADGSYTYTADGSGYGLETFTYTLTSATGTTADAVLTIDVGQTVVGSDFGDLVMSTAGSDEFTLGTGADVVSYDAMPASGVVDVWTDFSLADGDVIDLSTLLTGVTNVNVNDYLSVRVEGGNTILSVDTAGSGSFADLITLEGTSLDLATLLEHSIDGVTTV